MEELSQEKRWTHPTATIPVTEEKLAQIQKEIENQEVIIQGYQQVYHTAYSSQFQKQNCLMVTTFLLKTVILLSKKWMKFRCEAQTCIACLKSISHMSSLG